MKRNFSILVAIVTLILFILPVSADSGPKASLNILVEGFGDRLCYATVLSKTASTGPESAWDGNEASIRLNSVDGGLDIWLAFNNYEDSDGFYFLQQAWELKSGEIKWGYYPPQTFKLLLYFPDTGEYVVSPIYERYAFHSYFDATLDGESLTLEKSYPIGNEILGFVMRLFITILIELAVALFFGFENKSFIPTVLIVNLITQVILNLLLTVTVILRGGLVYIFVYALLELFVILIEAVVYCSRLPAIVGTDCDIRELASMKSRAVAYAIIANILSFIVGLTISVFFRSIY